MLPALSVKRPYTVAVAVVLIVLLGVISFLNMTTDLLPNVNLPYILVITPYPGASPEKVEQTVTKPVEQIVSTTSGLKSVTSVSQENSSLVILQFEQGNNMDTAMLEISAALDRVRSGFEEGVNAPQLMRLNPDMLPVMAFSAAADGMGLEELSKLVKENVLPEIERLDGVGAVSATGLLEKRVTFTLQQEKIDVLNKKVLKAIDEELAKAQEELDDARKELEDGKKKYEREKKKNTNKLASASVELSDGLLQISQGIEKIENTLPALEKQVKTLKKAYDSIVDAQKLYSQMQDGKAQLSDALSQKRNLESLQADLLDTSERSWREQYKEEAKRPMVLGALQAIVSQLRASGIPVPPALSFEHVVEPAAMNAQLDGLAAVLENVISMMPSSGDMSELRDGMSQFDKNIKEQYEEMRDQFKELEIEMPDDEGMNTTRRMKEMKAAIVLAQEKVDTLLVDLPEEKDELKEKRTELLDKQVDLEEGKIKLATELGKIGATLEMGEKQLEQGEEAFEKGRDEAYKNAGLNGVITKDMVAQALMAQNFSMPAGYVKEGALSYMVKVGDRFESLDQLRSLVLFHIDEESIGDILLLDVGVLSEEDNYDELYAKINGNDAVLLTVNKQSVASTPDVCTAIRKTLQSLEAEYPGLHLTPIQDQGVYINLVMDSVLKNLMFGGMLAILVLLLFLRDWRPTLITGLSIPVSLLFAIVMMYFSGVSLNIISISGLALGVGMLVDNSIVAIENIYRLRKEGVSPLAAAVQGTKQLAGALTSSTLTTISVFLPIVFTKGITREIFTDMGLTIGYSLIASLLVALTLVPAMGSVMLVENEKRMQKQAKRLAQGKGGRFMRMYEKSLIWSLRHKWVVLGAAAGLLALCVALALDMGTSMFPKMNSNQMTLTITTGRGKSDADIRGMSDEIMELVRALPEVHTVGAMQEETLSSERKVTIYALMDEERNMEDAKVDEYIRTGAAHLDCKIEISYFSMDISMLTGKGITVQVKGHDLERLRAISAEIAALFEQVEGTENITNGTENSAPELRVLVDKNKAIRYGLTTAQIVQQLASALQTDKEATTLTLNEEDFPLLVVKDEKLSRGNLKDYTFEVTVDGEKEMLRLGDIASVTEGEGAAAIEHENLGRVMNVSAQIAEGYNVGLVSREFEKVLSGYTPPAGYSIELKGENEEIASALEDVSYMILIAIAFIYLIMVAQFQSLLSPFIVMFTIPLAFTGGFLALVAFGFEISIVAMIGMLILAGVVVNNGIVFVETVNQLRLEGMEKREALIATGKLRMRPIMMTALTTILALFTMAFGNDMGASLGRPLAIVTIGGLSYATVLTLIIVPAMYDIFHRKPMKSREISEEELVHAGQY